MVRVGGSTVTAGVLLATLSACDQSTAADPDHRPQYRIIVHDGYHRHHATNHLILGKCQPADTPDHTTVCAESHPLNMKECHPGHPHHGVVCAKPRRSN
jgi:hypothetical protein